MKQIMLALLALTFAPSAFGDDLSAPVGTPLLEKCTKKAKFTGKTKTSIKVDAENCSNACCLVVIDGKNYYIRKFRLAEEKKGLGGQFSSLLVGLLKKAQNQVSKTKKRQVVMGIRGLTDDEKVKKIDVEPNEALLVKMEKQISLALSQGIFKLKTFLGPKEKGRRRQVVMGIRGLTDDSKTSNMDMSEPDYDMLSNVTGQLAVSDKEQQTNAEGTHSNTGSTAEMEHEIQVGRTIAAKMLNAFEPVNNKKLMMYLNLLGVRVAQASGYQNRFLLVSALNTDIVNAFAAPGGYVFITKGALAQVSSEDELVAVLAHEAGHVFKNHLLQNARTKYQKNQKRPKNHPLEIKKRISTMAGGDSKAIGNIARFIGTNTGSLIFKQLVDTAYDLLLSSGMSKEFEMEADDFAISLTNNLGYEGNNYLSYLKRVDKNKGAGSISKTHPSMAKRLLALGTKQKTLKDNAKVSKTKVRILTKNEFDQLWKEVI